LNSLWVDERYRKQGIGGHLMAVAEDEAARGCDQVVLFTYLFQAPSFYERLGYHTAGRVDDYPMRHRPCGSTSRCGPDLRSARSARFVNARPPPRTCAATTTFR
jgi:ribosomal protein S18 acetylase RimI-like enzyme